MKFLSVKFWLLAVTASVGIASCDSQLTIAPVNTIEASAALNNEQGVQVTLTGAYDGLSDTDVLGGQIQYNADLLGDEREVVFGGTFTTLDEVWRKTITTVNANVQVNWRDTYVAINRANNVLASLDKVSNANRSGIEGSALFVRGLSYFELVRFYGKTWGDGDNNANPGVPIVLTPTGVVSESDNRRRNSVAEVYTQVINDLTRAESLLPANSNGVVANKAAAAAILSRVYLMQGNYTAARDAANRVITSANGYQLAANFADAFNDQAGAYSRENIFRIAVTEQDGANSLNTFYASAAFQGRGDLRVQQRHLMLYERGDVRGAFFYRTGQNTFTSKHRDQFGDVPVVRLAEMFLTRAECNQRLNSTVGASPLEDVNRIRTRVQLPALEAGQVNLDAILKERRLELAFEGHRIHDVRRTRGSISFGTETIAFNANRLVLPIPQREMDTNKNMTQNPGY
jgi:tetratricopeptide (TPR) repeat protein